MNTLSRLREIRKTRAVSATDLARRVGVSRQTIYAIEDGNFVPNTTVSLQLARALDVTVEEIFSIAVEHPPAAVRANLLPREPAQKGQLVRLCRVNERLVAVPIYLPPAFIPAADAIVESRTRQSVSIKAPTDLPEDGKRLLLAGCDPALSLLSNALQSSRIDIIAVPCASRRALHWLKEGRVHVAGSHLLDRTTGDYNLPIIRRVLPKTSLRVVTFAVWEQGFVLRRGNPKSIRSIADLASNNVKLINREKGSGSRDVLDAGLRKFGVSPEQVSGYDAVASGHLAAGYAVAAGSADCCIAPRSAARCLGLDFVPLTAERFDLSFTEASLQLPATRALLDLLSRSHFKKKLECLAGYDTAHTGEVRI
jgi:molybdate-binding protein/DNA-binding XRE family transcriptional regulator